MLCDFFYFLWRNDLCRNHDSYRQLQPEDVLSVSICGKLLKEERVEAIYGQGREACEVLLFSSGSAGGTCLCGEELTVCFNTL